MIKLFWDEKWKEVKHKYPLTFRYAITNYGRLIRFTDKVEEGIIIKGNIVEGYLAFCLWSNIEGKSKPFNKYYHRLVAEYFLPKSSPDQIYVIHLDYNKTNNHFSNLKWVTQAEKVRHNYNDPGMVENRRKLLERNRKGLTNRKLTETQVIRIKKMLFNPNRKTRMKIIAKQFGISEMQLYRIKSGENWGHIKI